MPYLSPDERRRRVRAIVDSVTFAEAAHKLGGITKEALQEWARDNPETVTKDLYESLLTASDRQREHLERARGAPSTREVPAAAVRFHCLGPCDATYDTYATVLNHRRGKGASCKGASYTVVLPDAEEDPDQAGQARVHRVNVAVPLPHDPEDEEELLRAIVATLDERDLLRERVVALEAQVARRGTVWSTVRKRLLGREG